MIKQDWNINDEDRRRILSLHETATKKNYLMFEQTSPPPTERIKEEEYTIFFYFPTGFHSINSVDEKGVSITQQVEEQFKKLKEFLSKYYRPIVVDVQIKAKESAVRNVDREAPTPSYKPEGWLAQQRSQTIQNLLTINFKNLVNEKLLPSVPNIVVNAPTTGVAEEKDSPEAKSEQFVEATIKVKGVIKDDIPIEIPCDLNIQIKVEYKRVPFGNVRYHCCDDAEFTLLLNNIPINVQGTDTSVFNLNNKTMGGETCGPRSQILYVDKETANNILAVGEPIKVSFQCKSDSEKGCHEAPMYMTAYRDGKKVEEGRYLGVAKNKKDRMMKDVIRQVATMDRCGKIIFVDQNLLPTKSGGE